MNNEFEYKIGDRVLVEVYGTIEVMQKSRRGPKYIIQPDDPRAAAIHASPEYVFPEDDDSDPAVGAEVIPFPADLGSYDEVA